MTEAEHNQLELERIRKLEGVMQHINDTGEEFDTQVWADSDKVYIAIGSNLSKSTFVIDKKVADILADQLNVALRRW